MRKLAIWIFSAFLTAPAASYDAGLPDTPRHPDPRELGALFCEARKTGDMSSIEVHLAPILRESISEAQSRSQALKDAGQASPLQAGIPWQARAEPPAGCRVEMVNGIENAPVVLVRLDYELEGGRGTAWSDVIQLERTPDSWLINNVFYANGGNLRFRLLEAFGG